MTPRPESSGQDRLGREESPRLLADVMLGSLARWLRLLGFDTAYDNSIDDDDIVRRCRAEGRRALTKDRRLAQRQPLRGRVLLIESVALPEQLRETLVWLDHRVERRRLLTRCALCNSLIEELDPTQAAPLVPPYVLRTQSRFKRCPKCMRIYWGGTHRERMIERLRGWGLLEDDG